MRTKTIVVILALALALITVPSAGAAKCQKVQVSPGKYVYVCVDYPR